MAFSEPSITGEELLQRSGLAVTLDYNAGLGGAVCSINNQGCAYPIKDCFCKCTGIQCEYWAYYHRTAAGWQYASSGASSFLVNDGALEGWSWGAGNFSSGVEPPVVAFNEVCAPPATATPTATATATPTATPSATATATVRPPQDQTPPQVVFEANTMEVSPGACTLLRWWVTGATELTLNGALVSAQDQRQVCPPATQRFTLAATNAAGQTVRELTVTIAANPTAQASVQPGSTATHTPTASAANTPSATPGRAVVLAPTIVPTLPVATVAVAPTPLAQPPAATPEPPRLGLAGIAVAHAQEIAPTAAPNSQMKSWRVLRDRIAACGPGHIDAADRAGSSAPTAARLPRRSCSPTRRQPIHPAHARMPERRASARTRLRVRLRRRAAISAWLCSPATLPIS